MKLLSWRISNLGKYICCVCHVRLSTAEPVVGAGREMVVSTAEIWAAVNTRAIPGGWFGKKCSFGWVFLRLTPRLLCFCISGLSLPWYAALLYQQGGARQILSAERTRSCARCQIFREPSGRVCLPEHFSSAISHLGMERDTFHICCEHYLYLSSKNWVCSRTDTVSVDAMYDFSPTPDITEHNLQYNFIYKHN